jgi:uncharacterized protein (DUF2236 family)
MLCGVSLRPVSQALGTPRTHRERISSRDGYFAPESVIRRVGDTPIVPLLGGGTAVLLQVAHPLVAAGVVEHSDYRNDLWRRLVRTLRALYLIVYGTKQEAEEAAAVVRAVHAHVKGVTQRPLGRFPAGTAYSASTPALQLWVHATLVQASLAAYERFVEQLLPEDEESYYQEMGLVARLFGTPDSVIPGSYEEFREYFSSELERGDICVTDPARAVASVILQAPMPAPLRLLAPAHRLSTVGLLPPKLREEYGLRWSSLHERSLPLAARSLKLGATPLLYIASRLAPATYTRAA